MEKNIELRVIETYEDLQLKKIIEVGKTIWVDEKRAMYLYQKKLVKIKQIVKK